MNKAYVYRKHLKYIKRFLLPTMLIFAVVLIIASIAAEAYGLLILALFFVFYFFLMNRFYKKLVTTKYMLTDEGIYYEDYKKQFTILYDDIKFIDSRSIRYTGGWLVIHSTTNKPLRLTVVVNGIGEFVENLKTKLDEMEKNDIYNEKKLNNFFKTSYFSDQSFERNRYYFPRYSIVLVSHIVVGILFSAFDFQIISMTVIGSLLLGLVPYIYVELYKYTKAIKKESNHGISWEVVPYDKDLARKRLRNVFYIQIGLLVLAVILGAVIQIFA